MKYPKTILVANRGEIAARIFRTARELGIHSIAVYAPAERAAAWTYLADEAYCLGGNSAAETYMNPEVMLAAAKNSGAKALHPGYGFLSENAEFARQVTEAGITWIGPEPQAIEILGNKSAARQLAHNLQIGVIPGKDYPAKTYEELATNAKTIGYPVLLKDPTGGGGRGITEIANPKELAEFCKINEKVNESGNCETTKTHKPWQGLFIEKRLVRARHIETQCLRDKAGNFVLISTRDCSVQRRNQKLIEQAPALGLTPKQEKQLQQWSEALFEAVDYQGAGTCEFLLDEKGELYFLEVNPRLQVEHTVSEEVTGTDLVSLQLGIAAGDTLPAMLPADITTRGCSLQMRITSEDPAHNLRPTPGKIEQIIWPKGPGIRIDSALSPGEDIPVAFDSLIAKIIVTAPDRPTALARARRALSELVITGVPHSAPLYEYLFTTDTFVRGGGEKIYTRWLEETELQKFVTQMASKEDTTAEGTIGADTAHATHSKTIKTQNPQLKTAPIPAYEIELDGKRHTLRLPTEFYESLAVHGLTKNSNDADAPRTQLRRRSRQSLAAGGQDTNMVTSPMQATVNSILVENGQEVQASDPVIVVEAMKMEQPLKAPISGIVQEILVEVGQSVISGECLVVLAPIDTQIPQETTGESK